MSAPLAAASGPRRLTKSVVIASACFIHCFAGSSTNPNPLQMLKRRRCPSSTVCFVLVSVFVFVLVAAFVFITFFFKFARSPSLLLTLSQLGLLLCSLWGSSCCLCVVRRGSELENCF